MIIEPMCYEPKELKDTSNAEKYYKRDNNKKSPNTNRISDINHLTNAIFKLISNELVKDVESLSIKVNKSEGTFKFQVKF